MAKKFPQYRIESELIKDSDGDYKHQPQVRKCFLCGWSNIIAITKDSTKLTTTVEDISSTYISRSHLVVNYFTTKLAAEMVIKHHYLEYKQQKEYDKKNKNKKKVIYTSVNPENL